MGIAGQSLSLLGDTHPLDDMDLVTRLRLEARCPDARMVVTNQMVCD
jgi:hypothetical protein